jgi:DNA polymerase-3 subunit gamma/tau
VRFDDIVTQLHSIAERETLDADDAALALLAEAGDGSMRDALSIMDQAIASAPVTNGRPHLEAAQIRELMGTVPNTVFERLLESISENDSATVMTGIDTLLNAGNSPSQLARQLVRYLRNTLMSKLGGESTELLQISGDERARVARSAMLFSEEDLARFLQIMLRSFDDLNYRQEPRFHLELGLLKLVHTQRLIPLEQLLSQLPGGPISGGATGASRPSVAPSRPASSGAPSTPPGASQAPPRNVVSTEAARGGSVTSSAPAQPTFSPFESDTRRKSGPSGFAVASESAATSLTVGALAVDTAVEDSPIVLHEPAPAFDTAEESQNLQPHEPPDRQIHGHATPEAERIAADLEEEIASDDLPEPPAAGEFVSLTDKLRDAVTQALHEKGHETASALLRGGQWNVTEGNITVLVAVKKTMLSLTMNLEAERIARTALQQAGSNAKLVVLPGDGSASPAPPAPHAAKGSVQSHALDNPLVKQAQELFRAEVRDVLDLRNKH